MRRPSFLHYIYTVLSNLIFLAAGARAKGVNELEEVAVVGADEAVADQEVYKHHSHLRTNESKNEWMN